MIRIGERTTQPLGGRLAPDDAIRSVRHSHSGSAIRGRRRTTRRGPARSRYRSTPPQGRTGRVHGSRPRARRYPGRETRTSTGPLRIASRPRHAADGTGAPLDPPSFWPSTTRGEAPRGATRRDPAEIDEPLDLGVGCAAKRRGIRPAPPDERRVAACTPGPSGSPQRVAVVPHRDQTEAAARVHGGRLPTTIHGRCQFRQERVIVARVALAARQFRIRGGGARLTCGFELVLAAVGHDEDPGAVAAARAAPRGGEHLPRRPSRRREADRYGRSIGGQRPPPASSQQRGCPPSRLPTTYDGILDAGSVRIARAAPRFSARTMAWDDQAQDVAGVPAARWPPSERARSRASAPRGRPRRRPRRAAGPPAGSRARRPTRRCGPARSGTRLDPAAVAGELLGYA